MGQPADFNNTHHDRARCQALLEECRDLKDAIFEASADGIAIISSNGTFLDVNPAWERVMNLKRSELVGKTGREMHDAAGYEGPLLWERGNIQAGKWPAAIVMNVKGDTVLMTANARFGADGNLRYVIITARNLTQLNFLKDQLEKHGIGEHKAIDEFHASQLKSLLNAAGLREVVVGGAAIRNVLMLATQIAGLDTTVLLYGETGTGKGLVATLIHRLSKRADKPFVELNCGAIPDGLVESELFGYQPGAFTDSHRAGKRGQIEQANGGTLFLDEVSELPLSSQVKLLKFLDDKVIVPLGGASPRRIDVRIIAATNADLRALVRQGKFREDLFYRLEVVPLRMPPLRERTSELAALTEYYLARFNQEFGEERSVTPQAMEQLSAYGFPGNVRELRNLIARLVIAAKGREIGVQDLPAEIRGVYSTAGATSPAGGGKEQPPSRIAPELSLRESVQNSERQLLERYAQRCRSARELARLIGCHHTSVIRRLKKYQIQIAARPPVQSRGGTDT